jgi:hypothetical protein
VPKKFDHALNDPARRAIHAKKENPEKRYGNDYHPGGHKNFMTRRPSDLAHLDANFVQKSARPPGIFSEIFKRLGYRVSAPLAATAPASSLFFQLQRFRHKLPLIFPIFLRAGSK